MMEILAGGKKEKKGRLAGRKEKQNLQLFGFPGKAKDEIGHFNITSTHNKNCFYGELQNVHGKIVYLR